MIPATMEIAVGQSTTAGFDYASKKKSKSDNRRFLAWENSVFITSLSTAGFEPASRWF